MFFSKRFFLSMLFLIFIISTSIWLVIDSAQEKINDDNLPNYFVNNFSKGISYKKFNKDGFIQYQINSEESIYFHNQNSTLKMVNAIIFSDFKENNFWNITSNYGYVSNRKNNIYLYGDVVVSQIFNKRFHHSTNFFTQSINYDNTKDFLNTDKKIVINQSNSLNITTGVSLHAFIKNREFKILNNVRSYYVQF